MTRRTYSRIWLVLGLAAGLLLAACNSGPAKSGTASAKKTPSAAERKAEYIAGLQARSGEAGRVWGALTAALPDGLWLTEAAYDAGKIRIKGLTASNNLLADYISRLGSSPALANLVLGGSVLKTVRGKEVEEFSITASAGGKAAPPVSSEELEKSLPPGQDTASILRGVQRLALDAGFKMTKFTPGPEALGELTHSVAVAVDVTGDRTALARYLDAWAGLPGLWTIDKLSLRAASPDDARSPVRVSIAARTYFRP